MTRVYDPRLACPALAHTREVVAIEARTFWKTDEASITTPEAEEARDHLARQMPLCLDGAICQMLAMFRELRLDTANPKRLGALAENACRFLVAWIESGEMDHGAHVPDFIEWLARRLLCDPVVREDESAGVHLSKILEELMARTDGSAIGPSPGIAAFEHRMEPGTARNLSRRSRIGIWPLKAAPPLPPPPDPNRPFETMARVNMFRKRIA